MKGVRHRPPLSIAEAYTLGTIWLRLAATDVGLKLLPGWFNRRLIKNLQEVPCTDVAQELPLPDHILQTLTEVRRAASRPGWFNMSCLRRSLVTQRLLSKHSIQSKVVFGVHTRPVLQEPVTLQSKRMMRAHAWLVLTAPPELRGVQIDPTSTPVAYERLRYHG